MIAWIPLDTAPGGGGEPRLLGRGAEFSIKSGLNRLMNSRLSGFEEALAANCLRENPSRQAAAGNDIVLGRRAIKLDTAMRRPRRCASKPRCERRHLTVISA